MIVECRECSRERDSNVRTCPGCGAYLTQPVTGAYDLGERDGYHSWSPCPPPPGGDVAEYWHGYEAGMKRRGVGRDRV
jgi:hypothetical protein